jgi:hypothetical protein
MRRSLPWVWLVSVACHSTPPAPTGTQASFDLDSPGGVGSFFNFPWPSDLRRSALGAPNVLGFPNPQGSDLVSGLAAIVRDRSDFPVTPMAYFQFNGAVGSKLLSLDTVVPGDPTQPVLLIDVDPSSPDLGMLFPLVGSIVAPDAYAPANLVALSPPPGILLHGRRQYAFVIRRELNDASGKPLGIPPALWALENGVDPGGPNAPAAITIYEPLWSALGCVGVNPTDVAAATVFSTGDVVVDLETVSAALVARDSISLDVIGVPDGGSSFGGFCELEARVTYPQYQQGSPPFNTEGTFQLGSDGLPVVQGSYSEVPVVLTFPKQPMPDAGFPLVIYFHGSGGLSDEAVNRGPAVFEDGGTDGGTWVNTPGEGPAWVLAPYGFATAAAALPLNPERVPGATELEYLNLSNLAAFRDTFRQGVIEQRMLINALTTLEIPFSQADQTACGITLPPGQTALRYDQGHFFAQGQSMGGMYANLISAVESRILAVVPTGAGGDWQYFVLNSPQVPTGALSLLLGAGQTATWQHPTLMLLETAWEPVEPMVYAARLGRWPLSGDPIRPVYEPVGANDSFFSEATYDAMALAYGHKEAGTQVWPSMQTALALEGLGGIVPYPVQDDVMSEGGQNYTGTVVQYVDPTGYDGHYIFTQVPAVQHQYACFLSSMLQTGTATIVGPGGVGSPCQ